ncbi:MAG TPA: hypothetical protein VJR30_19025 [Bradyrhizobium sp.]|nr:hypothetical protein [Bradyrhizobium sp.]
MNAWLGVAFVATALALGTPAAAIAGTKAAPQAKAQTTSDATDFSARRVHRRYPAYPAYPRYARYPAYPAYYARPRYYRPYPYAVPAPFFLGFGYLPYY